MPIAALPQETVRQLGSSTIISSPVDVVKELLDNAIDSKAGSIMVLVSTNTVDRIEVRDDGHGIDPNDYDALGRAGYTSKLASFSELEKHGGSKLGFRGQALASANALGAVTITTRTSRDSNAVVLELSPGVGGVQSRQRTSAPVGTAVRISGLFGQMPVRQQFAVKHAQRNLVKISRLLQAYALAMPRIRLSLSYLGEHKRRWHYSPAKCATIRDAVCQVLGNDVASNSVVSSICNDHDTEDGHIDRQDSGLAIEAVLPKPGVHQSKVSSKVPNAAFFSVDSRPVSAQRGTMKKLQSMLKENYKKSLGSAGLHLAWKDPCICVNIRCSPGSYDVNIEPCKDAVLFADESALISLFDRLLSKVYAESSSSPFVTVVKRQILPSAESSTPSLNSNGSVSAVSPTEMVANHSHQLEQQAQSPLQRSGTICVSPSVISEHDDRSVHQASRALRAHTPKTAFSHGQPTLDHHKVHLGEVWQHRLQPEASSPAAPRCEVKAGQNGRPQAKIGNVEYAIDMSADPDLSSDEEAVMLASHFREQHDVDSQDDTQATDFRGGLNPWSIAKITASTKQRRSSSPEGRHHVHPTFEPEVLEWHNSRSKDSNNFHPSSLFGQRCLEFSSSGAAPQPQSNTGILAPNVSAMRAQIHDASEDPRSSHNDSGVKFQSDGLVQSRLSFDDPSGSNSDNAHEQLHISDVPFASRTMHRRLPKAKRGSQKSWASNAVMDSPTSTAGSDNTMQNSPVGADQASFSGLRQSSGTASDDTHIISSLDPMQGSTCSSPCLFPSEGRLLDGDPREYLRKRQRLGEDYPRVSRMTLKRASSEMLPLERIPTEDNMYHLVLIKELDLEKLRKAVDAMEPVDHFWIGYRAKIMESNEAKLDDSDNVETRLRTIVDAWTQAADQDFNGVHW